MVEACPVRRGTLTTFATASWLPFAFGALTFALGFALPPIFGRVRTKIVSTRTGTTRMSLHNTFLATVKAPHLPLLTLATTLSSEVGA